jgi:hypothetical protein
MAASVQGTTKKAVHAPSAGASTKTHRVKKKPAAAEPEAPRAAKKLLEAKAEAPKALDDLPLPSVFPLDALSEIKAKGPEGATFRLDSGFLDALRLQVRRIETSSGKPGMVIEFKITGPSREPFEEQLEKKGATREDFAFLDAKPEKRKSQVVLAQTGSKHALGTYYGSYDDPDLGDEPNKALKLEGKGWALEMVPRDGPIAIRGMVRLTLEGKDAECQAALKDAIQKCGLQPAFSPPTATSLERYAMMKLLWHVAPKEARSLSRSQNLSSLKLATIEAALKKHGVDKKRIDGLRYQEVAPGHFTVYDPKLAEDMKEAGLRYAYSTVSSPDHVHAILTGGQKATVTRWSEGAFINGMSSMDDIGSGGAQGVFSRLVTDAAHDEGWTGRTYKIVLKPELLGRLDIWGWPDDQFGQSWDLGRDNFGVRLLKDIGVEAEDEYKDYNEIVSPVGNGPEWIAAVVATSAHDRDKLIKHLEKEGYKPPNGKKLENLVVLAPEIKSNLLGGKAPKKPERDDYWNRW